MEPGLSPLPPAPCAVPCVDAEENGDGDGAGGGGGGDDVGVPVRADAAECGGDGSGRIGGTTGGAPPDLTRDSCSCGSDTNEVSDCVEGGASQYNYNYNELLNGNVEDNNGDGSQDNDDDGNDEEDDKNDDDGKTDDDRDGDGDGKTATITTATTMRYGPGTEQRPRVETPRHAATPRALVSPFQRPLRH